jgi:hypothetical protein
MQGPLPVANQAPFLLGKTWKWALLTAGLSLGVTALSPGVAEAQVKSPRDRQQAMVIPPPPLTQREMNLRSDPGVKFQGSFNPSTGVATPASLARDFSRRPEPRSRSSRRGPTMPLDEAIREAKNDHLTAGNPMPADPVVPKDDLTSAPGPLPLLGAGVAFAYSRRVRRRVNQGTSGKFTAVLAHS